MRNQEELQLEKMLDGLRELDLTREQLLQAEEYLLEGKEELLADFPKEYLSELTQQQKEKIDKIFSDLLSKNRLKEAAGLFQILYKIGGSTIAKVFPTRRIYYNIKNNEFVKHIGVEQTITIFASMVANEEYLLKKEAVNTILELADQKKERIMQAIDTWYNNYVNGKLLLYSAYFTRMIPEFIDEEGKLGDRKEIEESAPEFQKYFENFEELILKNIDVLLSISEEEQKVILDYISLKKGNDGEEAVLELFRKHTPSKFMLRLLIGCGSAITDYSDQLKRLVQLCCYSNLSHTMEAIYVFVRPRLREKLAKSCAEDYSLDRVEYILWCGAAGFKEGLLQEVKSETKAYISALKRASLEVYPVLLQVLKENEPIAYADFNKENVAELQRKISDSIVPKQNARQVVSDYLNGNEKIETLYAVEKAIRDEGLYYNQTGQYLKMYHAFNGEDAFFNRCMCYMAFVENGYIFPYLFNLKGNDEKIDSQKLFQAWEAELTIAYQLRGVEAIYDTAYSENDKIAIVRTVLPLFLDYLTKKQEEMLTAFFQAGAIGRYMGVRTLSVKAEQYKESLLLYFGDNSKLVRDALVRLVVKNESWEEDVLKKLESKKAADRETALQILKKWNKEYVAVITKSLEKEKSKKLADMMKAMLSIEESNEVAEVLSEQDYIKEIHKGGKKRSLQWAYDTPFCEVHKTDGSLVGEEYMQAILLSYSGMMNVGVNKEVLLLTNSLNKEELAFYVNELFDKWLESGAEAKKKWVLYAAAIHGGTDIVNKLNLHINEWPKHSRGAIAAEAVKALALNDSPTALLIVDGISRKFKFKQIKTAASEALTFAAEQLGITNEELADRIVPDLGFNEKLQRIFDYGDRKFTVYITPSLAIEIFDENEKKIKNLPAPGKKDDTIKASAALEEYKQMKKQMKTTVNNQKLRLEAALSVERKWDITSWKGLFVKNPIMHQFAIGLIWGIYEAGVLKDTFRYMEDGSFNTEVEEEYELQEAGVIGLVHPIELSEDSLARWEEQLADYEIVQPIEQLKRKIYPITEAEKDKKYLERFGGRILNGLSLSGKLFDMGWYRGSVQDAGGFYTFYREDIALDLGVELHFSGSFVGYDSGEDITMYEARFYKAGTIKRGSYIYDEVKDEAAIPLSSVPARYFSEIVYQLEKATASSKEINENWRDKR
ncbi:hypothetical protein acsn021_18470 [Anaerocolumna cellulosilytica]|uniref:Uncharacterized protein n=1 Tax=Anaerocolumna cellulosilytica TaxID=433286 RepID=A0A6S6R5E8_9FIRM|nr:DUF4132 domain-containing protein [Anaerocolumna cellulosilytica]MBB5194759.1 hypothetical protein [Anaerocolumna cellulosilytica]BCJ94278.1 hypothetical protein acsn021_18470 [Anaerocolumna cellulosilytica]